MGEAIGAVLPLAVGVSLSPAPIIAVVLMLATPRGRANGGAFVLGRIVGLAAVGTIVLLVLGRRRGLPGGRSGHLGLHREAGARRGSRRARGAAVAWAPPG